MSRVYDEVIALRRSIVERGLSHDEIIDHCLRMERRYCGDASMYSVVRACEIVLEEVIGRRS